MSNKLRIRNPKGEDLIVIDLHTGKVHSDMPDRLIYPKVAETWWEAVRTAYTAANKESGKSFKDLILQGVGVGGEDDGDIIFQPGQGNKGGKGGDVMVSNKTGIEGDEPCPECHGDPRGVLMLDKYHPCKTCGGSRKE